MAAGLSTLTAEADKVADTRRAAATRSAVRRAYRQTVDFWRDRRPGQACLFTDMVREALGVNQLHEGVETPASGGDIIPFTGRGVAIGVVDCGIDPRHPAFLRPDGSSRVEMYTLTTSSLEAEAEDGTATSRSVAGIAREGQQEPEEEQPQLTYQTWNPAAGVKVPL